ncbi:SDR family NAD(P)-dependent oxidoreductase [Spirillospora sp. NPDC029432]|uniref:SDR family NAD(P)-dependent oxidoreductase n=1 Tax=Spirillospora sp. NPDC029432 TaxID=3154599 RepID=UPI0034515AEE
MTLEADTAPDQDTTIAVTGLACRFPGAPDAEAFWRLLAEGREGLTRLTDDRLAESGVPRALRRDPAYVPVAGLIDGQDLFDPEPFGFTDAEAALLDPQHRLFLECAWRALEQAGHGGGRGAGAVGVFAGAAQSSYLASNLWDRWDPTGGGADPAGSLQTAIATQTDYLPLQTAYRLNLTGPAVAVNTTCSTSLVAVHMAVQSLLSGECDTALAGGVSLIVPQGRGYLSTPDGIYSTDGRVRAFSAEGTGIVYSQGVGVVVLRRLREALEDGDPVLAVVHGTAVNNDGAAKTGFTAPSVQGQARVLAEAQAVAGIGPRRIGYVEAHGTATRIGDPIEVAALRKVFGETGPAWCGLGSVKSNIGHTNAAAGIASFIKTVLAVRERTLPASLHARPINELLGLTGSPFEVVTGTRPWDGPPLAGVSSFGIGGTNAHAILGPAPERAPGPPDPRPHPIVLSAHGPAALREAAGALAARGGESDGADLAHTLQEGREHLPYRLSAVSYGELGSAAPIGPVTAVPRVVFAFPGGGSARPGMGAALYDAEPVFAACVDECADLFGDLLGHDIREIVRAGDAERAHGPVHGLPALFAVSLATARLLDSWGIVPDTVLGHSLGEYTAAVVGGALRTGDAARLIAARSVAMAEAAGDGAMLAVPLPEESARELLDRHPDVDLAVVNAPDACVVSGPRAPVAALEAELRAAGLEPSRLRFDGAAHSRLIDGALPAMRTAAARLAGRTPAIRTISTVTGKAAGAELGTADHWVRQLRHPVRFSDAVRTAIEDGEPAGPAVLVQVGPGAALAALTRAHRMESLTATVPALAVESGGDDLASARAAAGRLWAHGVAVDFAAMHRPGRRRIATPGYAFQRRRFWIDPPRRSAGLEAGDAPDETEPLQIPVWHQTPPLPPRRALDGRWLVAGPAGAATERLAAALAKAGADITVLTGTKKAPDPAPGAWTGAIVLAGDAEGVTGDVLRHAQVARAFAEADTAPAFLLLVTRAAQRVEGADRPDPGTAAALALPRILAQERPGLRWRALDLDDRSDDTITVLDELGDLAAGQESGVEAAVRSGVRWVRGLRSWRPEVPEDAAVRRGRVALITGGLGDVGLTTAAHLARRGMRVVITSRSGPPQDGDRAGWLRLLAEEGLDIEVRQVDAADTAATAALVTELAARAPIDLVVHAAGVVASADLRPLRNVTAEHVTGHVAAKVQGALALRAALDALPPDRRPETVVLMSSAGTLLGGIGMGPYCAANRYLDALAESLSAARHDGPRWVSAVWDAWKVGPMGGERQVRLTFALDAPTGMAALDRILAAGGPGTPPVVAVSATDLRERAATAAYTEPAAPGDAGEGAELAPGERAVAEVWSDLLGVPVSSPEADFFALGGHSLLATRMLTTLRRVFGVELRLRDLLARPTLGGLTELLSANGATAPATEAAPPARAPVSEEAEGEDKNEDEDEDEDDGTFPMTRVQHAYWVGRGGGYALGDIACHFYLEYDCPDLDVARYESAWRKVIERHPMLRTVTTSRGRLRTLDHVPPYRIRVHDLTGLDEAGQEARLARLRARLSRDPGPSDRWPLVHVEAARLPGGGVRLFIGVDVLICDAGSYWIIDREVRRLYQDPDAVLPEIGVGFAACARTMEARRGGEAWRRAAGYWRDRLDTIPGPPPLPVGSLDGPPVFKRRTARLSPEEWEGLRAQAARHGTTPTAVLLAAYAETLADWSGRAHFALTLTLFDRPPIHADVDSVVGDFTSLLIHEVYRREPATFAGWVRAVHERLFADLDHREYSALELLSERAARTGEVGSIPVVFTSALGLEDLVGGEPDLQWVGEQVHALSQTPQVWLDHQALVQRGELLLQWDAVDGLLPADQVDRVFTAYADRVRTLAVDPAAWDEPAGEATGTGPRTAAAAGTGTAVVNDNVLVPLRDGTGDRTLYLLHPSGGDVMCYVGLSGLIDERYSVVAVTDPGLLGDAAPDDLTGLAGAYLAAIRERSGGPYVLGGWSMGGSLGQEAARLLAEGGQHVETLLMFDANDPTYITPIEAPTPDAAEAEAAVRLLAAYEAFGGIDLGTGTEAERATLRALAPDARYTEVSRRLRGHRLLGRREDVRDRIAVFARHLRGLAAHTPGRIGDHRVHTLLVRADRPATRNSGIGMGVDDTPPGLPDLGWSRHLAGPLDVHGLDTDHYGLLRPPALPELAALIDRALPRS